MKLHRIFSRKKSKKTSKENKKKIRHKNKSKKHILHPKEHDNLFRIIEEKKIVNFPSEELLRKKGIRYALIRPYAYSSIKWKNDEFVYTINEPIINETEQKALEKIKEGLIQTINVSPKSLNKKREVIHFLEDRVKKLIIDYGINLDNNQFLKIMYYIYRNFVGLNEIEPLMQDPYIEDISCDGIGTPVYVIHQKLGSVVTNIVYNNMEELKNFVIKLAEKSDRYISYASPLMDGTLPDGSRIQISLAEDVTTKGPTFSIRKFRSTPFTPIDMMRLNTASVDMLAYLWFAVENGSSMLVAGPVSTGKTSFLNTLSLFIPSDAKVVSIEDSITGDSEIIIQENEDIRNITIEEFVNKKIDAEVMTLTDKGKIVFVKPSKYIKHTVKKDIYEVLTATGRRIKVTADHSLFSWDNNGLLEVKPTELEEGKSFIAVPRVLPIDPKEIEEINLMKYLYHFKKDFLCGEPIKKIFEKFSRDQLGLTKNMYNWWKRYGLIKIEKFMELGVEFSYQELKSMIIKSKNKTSIPVIFDVTREFLEFCGLWIGDGSFDNYNRNAVIISNSDEECRDIFKKIAKYVGSNYSLMNDGGVSLRLHSTVFYKFMKKVLKFDGYSSTKKIPDFIFNLSNEQVKHFIRGYFSADGGVKKYEVSVASQSLKLLERLQTLFLRFGIIARINDFNRKDKCINFTISSGKYVSKFKEIGFIQKRKNDKLNMLNANLHHTHSDIIPLTKKQIIRLNEIQSTRLSSSYLSGKSNVGREYLQKLAPTGSLFNDISHSDIFWDRVKKITKISSDNIEVFDLSIPNYEKFICNNVFVHNTREINLPHDNWIPGVTRSGFSGTTGEVSMFDLLKESFRQNPEYLIVGEVRGKEASVMFQAMASGHIAYSTMHAGSVDDVIKRLETPPINLSPGLLDTLDLVIIMTHATEKSQSARRVKEMMEIVDVDWESGEAKTHQMSHWAAANDEFSVSSLSSSHVLKKLADEKGLSMHSVLSDVNDRKKVLHWLSTKDLTWREVADYISLYEKDKKKMMLQIKK